MQKLLATALKSSGDTGDLRFTCTASTASRDRDGDIIEPSGWQLDRYRKNPAILFAHDHARPVGRALRVAVEGSRLVVEGIIPRVGGDSDRVAALVRAGVLNAVSVGFLPVEWQPLPGGGRRYTAVELLELSLCSVPSNPDCLITGHSLAAADPATTRAAQMTLNRAALAAIRGPAQPRRLTVERARLEVEALRLVRKARGIAPTIHGTAAGTCRGAT